MKSSTKRFIFVAALMLAAVIGIVVVIRSTSVTETKTESAFQADLFGGEVSRVYVTAYSARVLLRSDIDKPTGKNFDRGTASYTVVVSSRTRVAELITYFNAGKDVAGNDIILTSDVDPRAAFYEVDANTLAVTGLKSGYAVDAGYYDLNTSSFWDYLPTILIILITGAGIFLIFRAMNGQNKQAIGFSRSKARLNDNVKVRFEDVAGAEEEKNELAEIVEFLKNPQKFSALGARIPKGVLLVGPPGTGKTLFAKAVAGEANVPFFSISGSDFVEMFVGVGASRVRDLFDQAKKHMPCILFIDEIDAVGRQRGAGMGGGHDEREQTLNQLLVQMDGFETNEGIIIMAATNRADILDPALLRPGRFDRQIYVHVPDVRGRELIFKVHARNKPLGADIDYKALARITSGFTGADIENLLNEAAILAARAGRTTIIMPDINEGINKVIMGPAKKSRLITEFDKRITAYHEAGHAIVAETLTHVDKVHEISIIGRGQAAGYTMTRPTTDDNHVTRNMLNDRISLLMGGRSAEELVIKDITTGAQGDIKQATEIAKGMVTEFGMSGDIGPIFLGGSQEVFLGRDYQNTHTYSEKVAAQIDAEIRRIIEENHKRAFDILTEKKDILERMVRVLIEHETIYEEEVKLLMSGASLEEINAAIAKRG
jgi:cell division protease FtsH